MQTFVLRFVLRLVRTFAELKNCGLLLEIAEKLVEEFWGVYGGCRVDGKCF
ncbi:MAG: hypothetical protein ABIB47_05975 [Candidatus Woesearchaeota archaeon]